MADKSIGDLPKAAALYDNDRMVLEQNGEAKSMEGALLKSYIAPFAQTAEQAAEAAESALEGVREAIENIPEGTATPIVNDLTTGGASMALSAEMGKKLSTEQNKLLPLDGSKAMTGALNFQTVNNGSGRLQKSHSDTADYGTILRDFDKNGNLLSVVIRAALGTVSVAGRDGVAKEILHTGNSNRSKLVDDDSLPTMNGEIYWRYK